MNFKTPPHITSLPDYSVLVRAIYDRGDDQRRAISELTRRGVYLTDDQRERAGLPKATEHASLGRELT